MGPKYIIIILTLFGYERTNGQMHEKGNGSIMPEDGDLNITANGEIQTMPLEYPMEILQLSENMKLEKEIQTIKDEQKEIVNRNLQEKKFLQKEKSKLEQKYKNKLKEAKEENMNQDILVRFMKNTLYYNHKKANSCQGTAQAQKEKLEYLEKEKKSYQKKDMMNLKNADLQDDIIKSQEREIEILNATLEMQTILYEDYEKMNNFDLVDDMENFPVYAQLLTKTLADQNEKIKQMNEYFEGEKKVNENMEQILKEIQDLKVGFAFGKTDWDLLDHYKDIISILDDNLKSILPAISYASITESNRKYQFETADDGTLLEMTLCQCLPRKGKTNVNVTISAVELTCPKNTLFSTSFQRTSKVPCTEEHCRQEVVDTCGNFTVPVPVQGLVIAGGNRNANLGDIFSSSVTMFNPAEDSDKFCHLPSLPVGRSYHTLDMSQDMLFMCGGEYTESTCLSLAAGEQEWKEHSALLEKREDHSSWVTAEGIFLLGGRYSSSTAELVNLDNEELNRRTFNMPHKMRWSCTIPREDIDGRQFLIITGGRYTKDKAYTIDAFVTKKEDLPYLNHGRWGHGCSSYKTSDGQQTLVVTGGWDGSDRLSSTEVLHPGSPSWTISEYSLPSPRTELRVANLRNVLYGVGGQDRDRHSMDEILVFDKDKQLWEIVGRLKEVTTSPGLTLASTSFCN